MGLFLSPVGYSSSLIASPWQWLYACNPLVGIIDGFRWSLFGWSHEFLGWNICFSWCMIILLCGVGLTFFQRWERGFADVI